jgi:uncharacterized protein (DUF885 family)
MHFNTSHRRFILILLPFLIVSLTLSILYGIHIISPTDNESYHTRLLEQMEQASSFSEFTNALFCYETTSDSITTAYTLKNPAAYNIPALEPDLTSFSCRDYQKENQSSQNILGFLSDNLKRFSDSELTESEQITYSLLTNNINLSKAVSKYPFYEELLGSSSGVQANLPVTLGEYPLRNEEDVKTYLNLLKQVPAYFEDVISYEEQRNKKGLCTPDFLLLSSKEKMETMLDGFHNDDNSFIDTFNERISKVEGLSGRKQQHYKKQNENYVKKYVISAYENLYQYMEKRLESTSTDNLVPDSSTAYGLSSLPDGDKYYSLLVKSATGSSRPVTELISMTEQALSQALGDVLNIAITDQKSYFYYCENSLETYYQSPEVILEALSLMIREDYPVLNNTPTYQVKNVSESLASSLSPAFYMIPAIDDYQNNTIYINALYTNEENGNLFTTLAHEGFPGHLYQTVYFNDTHPDSVRQSLNYPGYVEGWATYVEMNAFTFLDYPLEGDSLCRLYQADTIINLALCSRIDMGVNYEGWTLADTCKFFEDNGFNSTYAADVYTYVVETPANYLSYFIGYLEILDLKEAYKNQEMENYSEKDFHKKLLDIGPADFETIRKEMLTNSYQP